MVKRSMTLAALLVFSAGFGCRSPQRTGSPVRSREAPDLAALLHTGMTDQQALDTLAVTGPVTYVGGMGGGLRMVQSPTFPGIWIILHLGHSDDGDLHLIGWSTSIGRPAEEPGRPAAG
jgi:hypothetical protein